MKNRAMLSIFLLVGISLIATDLFSEENLPGMRDSLLMKYEASYRQFKEIEIGDKTVYFYQRTIEQAIVEKDFIVYHFDKNRKELLSKYIHWRGELPEHLPPIMITKEQAESMVEGRVQFSDLYYISPESDVFPIKPAPENPCWVVRSMDNRNMIVKVIDAVEGKILGNGIPPPYTAFALSGPQVFDLCGYAWDDWYQNAAHWFDIMGYSTEATVWPTKEKIKSHVQSSETVMFYEIAHSGGRSDQFESGCANGTEPEFTYASEIETWIANYEKIPFVFLASCYALCDTSDGTLSYEFRKGSREKTVTVGYCEMSEQQCSSCWTYSLRWQDTLFFYMNQGLTVKNAFVQANLIYPACAIPGCIRFAGDENLAVIPEVAREPIACGEIITKDIVLHNDLLDCTGNGLVIGANNVTIDCNGHLIDGDGIDVDHGIYLKGKSGVTIRGCTIQDFENGIYLDSSSNNNFTDNTIRNNSYGAYFSNSEYNTLWGNRFISNKVGNAYEVSSANSNNWDLANTGNYWSDCFTNPGCPNYYEIPGPGDGIDHHPVCPNNPPGSFSLLLPENSAFVSTVVAFDWANATDPDVWDTLRYSLHISTSLSFHRDSTLIHDSLLTSEHSDTLDPGMYYWKVKAYDRRGGETWSTQTWKFYVFLRGDANGDGKLSVADVVFLINYLFKGGTAPNPLWTGDANCDVNVRIADVVYLINYLFKSGSPPGC